ncbi:MAG: hypothetical protein FJX72_14655, partial [Armatimonadetes bacterium]|nr:hypothetical protein [Armatimonadota bacterium]
GYRPIPDKVTGLRTCVRKLDGIWRIRPGQPGEARKSPLTDRSWRPFRVPGQWLQQGVDTPPTEPVNVATEFTVPGQWAGRRLVLRFDAVHAGTEYRINGKLLGHSENLFTPVEWDVTDFVVPGRPNRLDMTMVVQTESERLAHASGYAFHNLGGIPRSVRVVALPNTHVRALRIRAGLDAAFTDGRLDIAADIEGPEAQQAAVRARVDGTDGPNGTHVSRSSHSSHSYHLSHPSHSLSFQVPGISPWTNEHPHLYALTVELVVGSRVVERITRKIGFRTVEVRGSKLLVNGRSVKLAGACRHETHPLTGRADTVRHAREDVRLMKEANLNYIRTAHYPPTQELLDEADRQGMFVEVEAPFCWVGDEGYRGLREVLTPTSAMVDYHHWHPSVIIWSLANESAFNPCFEVSNRLVKDLDPTRPTTFNNPDPKRICDIANVHYPRMPFDDYDKDDPRPLLLGEYFFPVCHEQTDVRRNPGLRELWGAGHSDAGSAYGKACAGEFENPYMQPGEPPGAWTHIVQSERVIGGAIWAALDEPFYLPGGKQAGYAWVHGFWGIVDAWRRPKPEHWLSRQVFSPVWFPVRRLPFSPGATEVEIPVENRFAFTDLDELRFEVRVGRTRSVAKVSAAPDATGSLVVQLPRGAARGDEIVIEAKDPSGRPIVSATVWLGEPVAAPIPAAQAGARQRLTASAVPPPLAAWPSFHATRFDFGDLWPGQLPFAVLPTRSPEREVRVQPDAVVITERSPDFEGEVVLRFDASGLAHVAYDMVRTGDDFRAREIGLRLPLPGHDWRLQWERWSEWGDAPQDSIMRRSGVARPFRGSRASRAPESARPRWPWALDETVEGTADFRSVKLNVTEASLRGPGGGVAVYGRADIHVRTAIEGADTALYLLTRCAHGPKLVRKGDRLQGELAVSLEARH